MSTSDTNLSSHQAVGALRVASAVSRNGRSKNYMETSMSFDALYKERKLHPGSGYLWFANCAADEVEQSRFKNKQRIVVKTALNKKGETIPGWVSVFYRINSKSF